MNTKKTNIINRRDLLKASAASVIALPYLIPSKVLGETSPSKTITIGCIGTGNMGTNNLKGFLQKQQVRVLAVCDVDAKRRDSAKTLVDRKYGNNDCKAYNDFREITRRKDIDAVCITTPDHWHTIPALDAIRNGKDAYVEKPLTLTVQEGRILSDTAARYGSIVQTGSQQRSSHKFKQACELVRNGRIGKVHTINIGIPGNNKQCQPTWTPEPIPAGLDYDLWLGPAPYAPYHNQRCHYQFRFILDYSGGQVTNWGAHYLDIAQWGLGMDNSGPVEVKGNGQFPSTGLFTTATKVHFELKYANGTRLICKTKQEGGLVGYTEFIGTDGSIFISRNTIRASDEEILKEQIGPNETKLYNSSDHKQNFIDCIHSRTQPICNAETGHRSATLCHLGNIAMLTGQNLKWNPETERFTNNENANTLLSRPMRGPWHL